MGIEALKLDHLRYFVAAVEAGSFATAGEKLNITPTSVAHGIKAIEDTLGINLLIRKRASGVIPNRQGAEFLTACRKVLLEIEHIGESFQLTTSKLSGELVVGCQEGLTWSIAPRAIEEMLVQHPDVSVNVKTIFMDEGIVPLEKGDVDLLITFVVDEVQTELAARIRQVPFFSQILCSPQAYALMHGDHPVCKEDKYRTVSLTELVDYPHIFIKDGPALPLFRGMYDSLGLEPNFMMVSNISPGAQSVVGKSEAVSLRIVRPSINLSPLGDELAFLPIEEAVMRPNVVAITHTNNQLRISRKAQAFINICQEKFDDGTLKENFFY